MKHIQSILSCLLSFTLGIGLIPMHSHVTHAQEGLAEVVSKTHQQSEVREVIQSLKNKIENLKSPINLAEKPLKDRILIAAVQSPQAPQGPQAAAVGGGGGGGAPIPEFIPNQNSPKPNNFFQDIRKVEADLFSGAASYSYPLWVPQGRRAMTPNVNLSYSSNMQRFDSLTGFGWSLPTNGIFRSTEKGSDNLFTDNDFVADMWGNSEELIITNVGFGEYAPKNEGSFTRYSFQNNSWIAVDTLGTKYYFGQSASSRQDDPTDATKVYKWMLDKVEDTNGNFMTLTYYKDAGQIYPDTIKYTKHGNDQGIYEVRFTRTSRSSYSNYERGFKTETKHLIDEIQLYSYHAGQPQLIRTYDLDYTARNNAVVYLTKITVRNGGNSLPPIQFTYYDKTNVSNLSKIDLLKEIIHPYGAKETLYYRPSTAYRITGVPGPGGLSNKGLPFVVHTLTKKSIQPDPGGSIYTTEYGYSGGHYYYDNADAFKKQYAGFHEVLVKDPLNNVQKIYFHQSEFAADNTQSSMKGEFQDHISKRGRVYRQEQYDNTGGLYQVSINKWEHTLLQDADPDEERHFVSLKRETNKSYDGNGTERTRATERTYDIYGNVQQETNFGRVNPVGDAGGFTDTLQDKKTMLFTYAHNPSKNIHKLPVQETVQDFSGGTIGQTKHYYDNLGLNQVSIGNETKTEQLVTAPSTFISTEATYNSMGMPLTHKNPRGYTTQLTYDTFNLYPTSATNAKGHISTMEYHYHSGQISSTTNPNGAKATQEYDNFGRIIASKVSDPSNPAQLLTKEDYIYNTASQPVSITQNSHAHITDTSANTIVVSQVSYFDGTGRPTQVRSETEGSDQYIVTSRSYDERGNLKKETLPVQRAGISYQTPAPGAAGTAYTYDALNRQTQSVDPLGTTTIAYDIWEKRVTDPNSIRKDLVFDAYENLIAVKEYLNGNPHTTSYDYDANNNLIKITDADSNIRNMTYDLLGRKLSLQDLHTANDTTYGTWVFTYDDNGNVTSTTDPKNQTIQSAYDELDRSLTQDYTGQSGIEVTYTYDQGTYGKGKLSSISIPTGAQYTQSEAVTKNFTYDLLGRPITEVVDIGNENFQTSFAYDITGNQTEITYPDSLKVNYGLNNAGFIETVTRTENAATKDVVNNIDYAPNGAIASITYENGSQTTDTFDINKLYRLTHRETLHNGTKLQDLWYTYDAVGNLTSLQDNSQTNTKKMSTYAYDDLYRLTQVDTTNVVSGQNYIRNYTYDIIGNITNHPVKGAYTYAGGNSATANNVESNPHAVTTAGAMQYTYDKNGNFISDGTWTHTFNFQDHLVTSIDGNKTINYLYDANGTRVVKNNTTDNKKTYYANQYYDREDATAKRHIYVNDRKVATVPKNL